MKYNRVEISGIGAGYQEILYGQVVRYCDLDGNTLFNEVPSGHTAFVVSSEQPTWALPDPVVEQTPVAAPRTISKLDYMNRFLESELETIYSTAKVAVQVEVWLEKFRLSEFVDLDDPRTVAGLNALESAGLIGVGRANEILG